MEKNEFFNLFVDELCDIYDAERQLVNALPRVISAVVTPKLKDALTAHLEETKNQVKRIDNIFNMLDEEHRDESCEAMEGLIEEVVETIDRYPASPLRDAALIAAAQRIEHYEIAVYGTLKIFAKELDLCEVADILCKSLEEEGKADKTLTSIAEGGIFTSGVNRKAMKL